MHVAGRDLIAYLQQPSRIHRLNPLHDRGRPYSEDAIYTSGFSARFEADGNRAVLDLDPDRLPPGSIPGDTYWMATSTACRRARSLSRPIPCPACSARTLGSSLPPAWTSCSAKRPPTA
jgi:hypothetical protein